MQARKYLSLLVLVLFFGLGIYGVSAQDSPSVLYVPLIGVTTTPDPLTLPSAGGTVTYHYAVKSFLGEVPLTDVRVTDDTCGPVQYVEGDDNGDSKLDYSETWRYTCTHKFSSTTQSAVTATGIANGITAIHRAYTTVVVGSDVPPPLISVVNITKVAYPLSLPIGGGPITYTYKVNNPGIVPLSGVSIVDDKCPDMSSKLGDTNANGLLDVGEVWIYTCTTTLTRTTTNTVHVTAYANGLRAIDDATLTVKVETMPPGFPVVPTPSFPETGLSLDAKTTVWGILTGILALLVVSSLWIRDGKMRKKKKKQATSLKSILLVALFAGVAGVGSYLLLSPELYRNETATVSSGQLASNVAPDALFGWKFPVVKFPIVGSTSEQIAYSSIRDPGGIPQGLPVRLKIPVIGVDSAIEDALITPDGRMDVPSGSKDVAWFALGPHPGQVGSAVIGGHFGISDGVPYVFYNLDKLRVGDKFYIVNDKGDTLAFVVRSISLFDRNADATTVFTSNDGLAHLNLITCEGVWTQVNGTYPQRRVVFADEVLAGEAAAAAAIVTRHAALAVGSKGADVLTLQNALVLEGFLKIPAGIAKGYFGALTRVAVAKFQASVGLPATGVYDDATRAKLVPQLASASNLPSTGIAAAPNAATGIRTPPAAPVSPTSFQGAVRSALSFYTTPIEGALTSLLLFFIALFAYKLFARRPKRQK